MIYFPQTKDDKSLGTALGEALGALAHGKAEQLVSHQKRSKNEEALKAFGFAPEKAKQLAGFDDQIIREVVKNERKKPSLAYTNAVDRITGGKSQSTQQEAPLERFAQQGQPSQFGQGSVEGNILEQLRGSEHKPLFEQPNILKRLQQAPGEQLIQNLLKQQQGSPQQQAPAQQRTAPKAELEIDYSGMTPEERKEVYKLQQDKRKEEEERVERRFKESKKERQALLQSKRSAETKLHDLERFEELEKEGKLNTPGYVEFLKNSGFDIPTLLEPGSQEFEKLKANFINGAKEAFGGRVSNFELESFMKTVPNLSQSPEGRKRVIANLKRLERAKLARYKAYREVLNENGGTPPPDLEERLEDKTDRIMKSISNQFRADLARPVPKGQNKFITALMSAAGSLVGVPGSILGKASKLVGGSAIGGEAASAAALL